MNTDKENVLRISDAESPLYKARPSMFRNHPIIFIACLALPSWVLFGGDPGARPLGAGLAVLAVMMLLVWWLGCLTTSLTITDRRVVLRRGILGKELNEVFIEDVRNVRLRQGPLQRLFGVGSLEVSSSGQADIEIQVAGIPRPDRAFEIINRKRT